jgi:hypothetical protein
MTQKGGAPGKKKEIQQATIQQNEQIVKQLTEQLTILHKYQDEPDSLQEAIDTTISQIAILKDNTEDLKARIKADEDAAIEKKAKALAEKEKETKKEPEE